MSGAGRYRPRASRPRRARRGLWRGRRGVTLAELIVATVIITIGLLALVSTSAAVARSLGQARQDNLAALFAQSRVEQVAALGCTPNVSPLVVSAITLNTWYTVTTRGVREKYKVTDNGNNTLKVVDSLSWVNQRATRKLYYETLLPCRAG